MMNFCCLPSVNLKRMILGPRWHTIKPGTPEHGTPAERRNNAGTSEYGTTERGTSAE